MITHVAHLTYPTFRLKNWSFSSKAKYARLRTLYGLAFAPHTHSRSGGSGALRTTRPTVSSVEKPTRALEGAVGVASQPSLRSKLLRRIFLGTTISISFQSVLLPFIVGLLMLNFNMETIPLHPPQKSFQDLYLHICDHYVHQQHRRRVYHS